MMLGCWSAQQIQPEGNQHRSNKFLFFVWVSNSFVDLWPTSAWPLWLSCASMERAQNYLWLCHAWKPISWILSHLKYIFYRPEKCQPPSLTEESWSSHVAITGILIISDFFSFEKAQKWNPTLPSLTRPCDFFMMMFFFSTHFAVCPWMLVCKTFIIIIICRITLPPFVDSKDELYP